MAALLLLKTLLFLVVVGFLIELVCLAYVGVVLVWDALVLFRAAGPGRARADSRT